MKKTAILLLTTFSLFVFTSCLSSSSIRLPKESPEWLLRPQTVYPEREYLSAVGSGDTIENAQGNAALTLASRFRVEIKGGRETSSRYEEVMAAGDVTQVTDTTAITERIDLGVDSSLVNIGFGDIYTDERGRTYTVAYLHREETGRIYRERLLEGDERVQLYIGEAKKEASQLRAYAYLDAASVIDSQNEVLREQLSIINPTLHKVSKPLYNRSELLQEKLRSAQTVTFTVDVAGDEEGKIASYITSAMTGKGFVYSSNSLYKVGGQVTLEPTELQNNYENIRWRLSLEMAEESGNIIFSIEEGRRESAFSQSEARNRAFKSIEKAVNNSFLKELTSFLDEIALK